MRTVIGVYDLGTAHRARCEQVRSFLSCVSTCGSGIRVSSAWRPSHNNRQREHHRHRINSLSRLAASAVSFIRVRTHVKSIHLLEPLDPALGYLLAAENG